MSHMAWWKVFMLFVVISIPHVAPLIVFTRGYYKTLVVPCLLDFSNPNLTHLTGKKKAHYQATKSHHSLACHKIRPENLFNPKPPWIAPPHKKPCIKPYITTLCSLLCFFSPKQRHLPSCVFTSLLCEVCCVV